MTTELKSDIERRIKINGVKSGLLLGIITTALGVFYFYFITSIAKSPILIVAGPVFFYLFIPIFVIVYLCFDARKKIGGYWTFKQATTGIFIMFLVAYLLYLVFMNLIFYKFIEPNYLQKTQVAAIAAKTTFMKQNGASADAIRSNLAEMNKSIGQQTSVTIGSTVIWIFIYTIFIFIFALIFGSLFKKDPPYLQPV